MLDREPSEGVDPDQIARGVRAAIVELLERNERNIPDISADQDLMATGLTSLDLAALIAMLENRWQVDPFLEHVPITEVRTVGQLCDAYQTCLAGQAPGGGAPDEDLDRAMARGRRRAQSSSPAEDRE